MRIPARILSVAAASALMLPSAWSGDVRGQNTPTEAPAGFDNLTNGFQTQAQFDLDRATFAEVETIADGIGPVFNATSCADCHNNPVTGAISQVTEFRGGHFNGTSFVEPPGGSLINDRALDASIVERLGDDFEVHTFRTTTNALGDGFVEAIDSNTLAGIARNQPQSIRGTFIQVPVGEANGALRGGRFGWKNQHASLESFAADAYLNEMGITSPLQPNENTSMGNSTAAFDGVPDPEDDGDDVEAFARFMRSTKVPPRDTVLAATADAQAGSALFDRIGCNGCHVRTIVTAPVGTVINGGDFTVPDALGNKIIHPFSDFLLHNVGTGDGVVQNGGPATRNLLRTPPLWGVRTRARLMHDGNSMTRNDAILRHAGQATAAANAYRNLSAAQKAQLVTFLNSL